MPMKSIDDDGNGGNNGDTKIVGQDNHNTSSGDSNYINDATGYANDKAGYRLITADNGEEDEAIDDDNCKRRW